MRLPDSDHFSKALLDAARALPEGGGYRFTPGGRDARSPINPRDPHHDGVTSDLVLEGRSFAYAAGDGATYCCGVTLEAFWTAWTAWCSEVGQPPLPPGVDGDALVTTWFCPTMGHGGAATALIDLGLGEFVSRADARPGDLCQFWRSTDLARPSGHSVIFLGWGQQVATTTVRYWSSQPATKGIGVHEEPVGPEWTFAFARVGQAT